MSISTADKEILSQVIDDENGSYRLRIGQRVHYLTIPTTTFDEDTMCRPYLLLPKLPHLPDSHWTSAIISRQEEGSLTSTVSTNPLPEVQTSWDKLHIDVLSLKRTKRLRSGVHEVQYDNGTVIAKIACFDWDIPRIERETWA